MSKTEVVQRAADEDRAEAERYRWLRDRFLGADFEWGEPAVSVILFKWPSDAKVWGDLNLCLDAAMKERP